MNQHSGKYRSLATVFSTVLFAVVLANVAVGQSPLQSRALTAIKAKWQ